MVLLYAFFGNVLLAIYGYYYYMHDSMRGLIWCAYTKLAVYLLCGLMRETVLFADVGDYFIMCHVMMSRCYLLDHNSWKNSDLKITIWKMGSYSNRSFNLRFMSFLSNTYSLCSLVNGVLEIFFCLQISNILTN